MMMTDLIDVHTGELVDDVSRSSGVLVTDDTAVTRSIDKRPSPPLPLPPAASPTSSSSSSSSTTTHLSPPPSGRLSPPAHADVVPGRDQCSHAPASAPGGGEAPSPTTRSDARRASPSASPADHRRDMSPSPTEGYSEQLDSGPAAALQSGIAVIHIAAVPLLIK